MDLFFFYSTLIFHGPCFPAPHDWSLQTLRENLQDIYTYEWEALANQSNDENCWGTKHRLLGNQAKWLAALKEAQMMLLLSSLGINDLIDPGSGFDIKIAIYVNIYVLLQKMTMWGIGVCWILLINQWETWRSGVFCSSYAIYVGFFPYICHKTQPFMEVKKYQSHGWYGYWFIWYTSKRCCCPDQTNANESHPQEWVT